MDEMMDGWDDRGRSLMDRKNDRRRSLMDGWSDRWKVNLMRY